MRTHRFIDSRCGEDVAGGVHHPLSCFDDVLVLFPFVGRCVSDMHAAELTLQNDTNGKQRTQLRTCASCYRLHVRKQRANFA